MSIDVRGVYTFLQVFDMPTSVRFCFQWPVT